MADHYKPPDPFTRHVLNPLVAGLTRLGIGVYGARGLAVPGRRSGEPWRAPVNLLRLDGDEYLVAPRGDTRWVRNIRATGTGRLLLGRRAREIRVAELDDARRPSGLRANLRKCGLEVGMFFDGVSARSGGPRLLRIAPDHPVFRLERS